MNYRFEVEQDKHGNWTALGYKDESLIETITCVSKHSHAVSAGLRWKKRMLERVFDKKSKVIKFGKFNGKTIEYVLINEPSYIMWMQSNKVADISDEIVADATLRETQRLGATIRVQTWGTGYMRQDT